MINCNSYDLMENEHLYGPGKRLLIYLQGCSLHCKGCFNSHIWKFGVGTDYSAEDFLKICKDEDVEGITVLGGEPLDQAEGLLDVVQLIKDNGYTVILFTGYVESELDEIQRQIWDLSDIVICGRYEADKKDLTLQFRGSSNQEVIVHKGKYENFIVQDGETDVVVTLSNDGELQFKGFYPPELKSLFEDITIENIRWE